MVTNNSLAVGQNMKNSRAEPTTFSNLKGNSEQGVSVWIQSKDHDSFQNLLA